MRITNLYPTCPSKTVSKKLTYHYRNPIYGKRFCMRVNSFECIQFIVNVRRVNGVSHSPSTYRMRGVKKIVSVHEKKKICDLANSTMSPAAVRKAKKMPKRSGSTSTSSWHESKPDVNILVICILNVVLT